MDNVTTFLTEFVSGLHPLVQFVAVFAIGIVPFLESQIGSFIGVFTGVPIVLAVLAAIAGNLLALAIAAKLGSAAARKVAVRRDPAKSRGRDKVMAKVNQFGVPVASLLGPFVLATALSTFIMIGAGLNRKKVLIWQVIAVIAWGLIFTVLGLAARAALT
ncbi:MULTISPECIES: hypothetical protein [Actinoalloteichus]|uniref:Small multidrug efflux protein n=1 Tax=Actinoalloteichus fjordicus TaxID=1612552 RepID=A0AAC9LA61_9PSEU|nr:MULTISPECIES: hypothetical protein [Actinoalloteichus]APU14178.1 hypothetical protein UA74_10585 [Actinoalloteichus fjordicus]APU20124.1 hypothetical protein UA75_10555 [Actinoalloteichus sp. GBA129-24]